MMVHVKRVIRFLLSGIFLLLGIAGLFLPILQGWLFLCLAVFTLSRDFRFLSNLETRLTARFPKIGQTFDRLRKTVPLWD